MNVVTFDFETTGLLKDPNSRIIEVGAVKHNVENGKIIDTFQEFVHQENITDAGYNVANNICGITKEQINTARPATEVINDFVKWSKYHLCYSWNLQFDQKMFQRSLRDHGYKMSFVLPGDWMAQMEEEIRWGGCWQTLYTLMRHEHTDRWKNGNLRNIALKKAIQLEGMTNETQEHRALSDAILAAKLAHLMIARLQTVAPPRISSEEDVECLPF